MKINYTNKHYVRVRYAETDKMGYCYYGNYASFLEIGRVESLRSLGISYKSLEDNGIMLPVSEFQIKYFSPAYYDDMLLIETKISAIKGVRIYFDYFIYNDNQKLLASAMTSLVFIDAISKKDVTAKKIYKYFEDFFKLSIQYINDQKERVINRLEHDENLKMKVEADLEHQAATQNAEKNILDINSVTHVKED